MSNLTNPPILDNTGQDILSALANIKRNLPQGGGSADPSLHFDWSNQTLPQTGDTNTIYCIPTGDTSDPWDFYAWNDTDQEFVKIDFNMTISIDSALSDTSTNPVQNRVVKSAIDAKADNTQTFTEASTRANIASGETFAVILGKIKKFFTDLKTVAFSGSYNDLSDRPTIPAAQVNSDWNASSGVAQILNKPTIPAAQVNSDWNASSGVAQILNKPTIPAEQIQSDWNQTTTTAKDYIKNKPTIPSAQVNSDWNASSGVAQILNKPSSMPASDVYAWAKAATKPSYTASEVGALASDGTAAKATADADGNTISSTYMKKGVDYVTAGKKANTTLGSNATAEGYDTTASGSHSHAEGLNTTASGHRGAHAEGYYTIAKGYSQHVEGRYNVEDTNNTYAHIIGGGTANNARKNIFTVDWNGDVNAGRSNGLTNDTKLPTGADVISYLNSNFVSISLSYDSTNGYFPIPSNYKVPSRHQLTYVVRNQNTGASYTVWYDPGVRAFRIITALSGSLPSQGHVVNIQYF